MFQSLKMNCEWKMFTLQYERVHYFFIGINKNFKRPIPGILLFNSLPESNKIFASFENKRLYICSEIVKNEFISSHPIFISGTYISSFCVIVHIIHPLMLPVIFSLYDWSQFECTEIRTGVFSYKQLACSVTWVLKKLTLSDLKH